MDAEDAPELPKADDDSDDSDDDEEEGEEDESYYWDKSQFKVRPPAFVLRSGRMLLQL